MGLGSIHTYSLDDARKQARECRVQVDRGIDPIKARQAQISERLALLPPAPAKTKECDLKTFRWCADAYVGQLKDVHRNAKHTSSAWRGVWMIGAAGKARAIEPARFPVSRGTMVMTSGSSTLLWLAGNAPSAVGGRDYFQGGKSIPKPIVLRRHMGRGPFDLLASEAMALAKMDWNNDALYDPLPVTIMYSQRLSRTISNVPTLPGRSYPYRLFM